MTANLFLNGLHNKALMEKLIIDSLSLSRHVIEHELEVSILECQELESSNVYLTEQVSLMTEQTRLLIQEKDSGISIGQNGNHQVLN